MSKVIRLTIIQFTMGIQGLIPFLEKASKPTNVKEFSGGTVAIDAYCWLHKGVFSCADKLVRGDSCDLYVVYCMKFINMLLSYNIKPILVFDGQKLPAKMETEKKRKELREQNRKKAAELMRLDRSKEAQTYLRRCIDVSHEMALNLIRICRSRNVDCIVAPYEADAQLAFLNKQHIADVIITEDSDLLLFGAEKVLFKMDINGNGLLVEQHKLYIAMGVKEEDFSFDKFRYMCILSGCDYLSSLPGIGLVKACRFIKRISDPDIYRAISRISLHLNMPQLIITKEYKDKFMDADFMFKYQPVYDPKRKKLVPLTELNEDDENYKKFRELISLNNLSEEQVNNLAYGNLDPFSLLKLDDWKPSTHSTTLVPGHDIRKRGWNSPNVAVHPSIWSSDFVPNSWTTSSKVPSAPPNALCPLSDKAPQEISQRLPKVLHNSCHNPSAKSDLTEESIKKQVEELKHVYGVSDKNEAMNQEGSTVVSVVKKNHHNPWIKDSTQKTLNSKNMSALSKLTRLFQRSEERSADCKVISRYFVGSGGSSDKQHETNENVSIVNHNSSVNTSPVPSEEAKLFSCDDDNQRSPLKMLNASDTPIVSTSTSASNSLIKETEPKADLLTLPNSSRKRVNPFAKSMQQEKKACVAGSFIEKLSSFKKSSSFSWSQPVASLKDKSSLSNVTPASTIDFKRPRTETEKSKKAEDVVCDENMEMILHAKKLQTQCNVDGDDEDEGFCSPNTNDSGAYDSSENSSTSPVFSTNRKAQQNCRISGLKKAPRQLSLLNMFAYRDRPKMKVHNSVR